MLKISFGRPFLMSKKMPIKYATHTFVYGNIICSFSNQIQTQNRRLNDLSSGPSGSSFGPAGGFLGGRRKSVFPGLRRERSPSGGGGGIFVEGGGRGFGKHREKNDFRPESVVFTYRADGTKSPPAPRYTTPSDESPAPSRDPNESPVLASYYYSRRRN